MMRLVARSWEMKNHSDAWRAGHFDTRSQGITQDTNRGMHDRGDGHLRLTLTLCYDNRERHSLVGESQRRQSRSHLTS